MIQYPRAHQVLVDHKDLQVRRGLKDFQELVVKQEKLVQLDPLDRLDRQDYLGSQVKMVKRDPMEDLALLDHKDHRYIMSVMITIR